MRTTPLPGLRTAGALLLLTSLCFAHGGKYSGPGDVVPPGGGGGRGGGPPTGPTTGEPAGPSAPAPGYPSGRGTGGSTGGGGRGQPPGPPGTTGRGGMALEPDLTEWTFWWEFNKDAYLRLEDAVFDGAETGSLGFYLGRKERGRDSLAPTDEQIHGKILPALKRALDTTQQRDITSSCMLAMAKVGADHRDFRLVDVFAPRLRSHDQEIRETAALAIGLAAIPGERELDLLEGLARDDQRGRDACGRDVDYRTRAFATYGLALVAHAHADPALKARAFAVMRDALRDRRASGRDLCVAAIHGMGVLDLGGSTEAERALLDEALDCLADFYDQPLGAGSQLIQAHCPTSIARLVGRDHARSADFRARFEAELRGGRDERAGHDLARSCALALGLLAVPGDDASQVLLETWRHHKDAQTRHFAAIALGQIGGAANRTALLKEFDRGHNHEQAWLALALGVLEFAERERDPDHRPNRAVASTLASALATAKDPSLVGALAIGLGLADVDETADRMRHAMVANVHKQDMAGHLCIGLALMDDRHSIEAIHGVARDATRREQLLVQASVALGKLGDKEIADTLQARLLEGGDRNLATLAALAAALGLIGDARSIEPLRDVLLDDELNALARAFAAVALGGIADREVLPWNAKLRRDMNYRAAVETLTDQATGILDLL